jgi:diguanylate cyclase (GGDEF)-like protein
MASSKLRYEVENATTLRRRTLVTVAVLIAGFALVVSLPGVAHRAKVAFDDVAQGLAALAAAGACWLVRRRTNGRSRRGWTLLSVGFGVWIIGQLDWIVVEAVLGRAVHSPSVPYVAFCAAIPVVGAGLLLVSFPVGRPLDYLRTVIDGVSITLALVVVALLVIGHMVRAGHASALATGVDLTFPIGDIAFCTIVLLGLSQAGPRSRRWMVLLLIAFVCFAVSDWYLAAATITGTYRTGRPLDAGWFAAFLVIAAGAWLAEDGEQNPPGAETALQAATPYLVMAVAVLMGALGVSIGRPPSDLLRWSGVGVFAGAWLSSMLHRERWRRVEADRVYRSLHDPLTGLPSFAAGATRLNQLFAAEEPLGLLYLDVDGLDDVNTSLGHAAGDALLRALGDRLRSALPARCEPYRVLGDEFGVLCPGASGSDLHAISGRVLEALETPFELAGQGHAVSLSIGLATRRAGHTHTSQLTREAHVAMVRAKTTGPGRVVAFEPAEDRVRTAVDLKLEDDLRFALVTGEGLVAHYQPIVRMTDGAVVGHEALVRWEHPERGVLAPDAFLPMAEATGLVVPLGWWMLDTCCDELARGDDPDAWVAVNVAGRQLGRGELVPAVITALRRTGIEPSRLHLEITESQFVDPTPKVREELGALDALGVLIGLDDFGTAYSSLARLRDLPVGVIKIDRTFVASIGDRTEDIALVRGLIGLCNQVGVEIVAEGIETEAQASLLRELACTYGQGYLFGRPSPNRTAELLVEGSRTAVFSYEA